MNARGQGGSAILLAVLLAAAASLLGITMLVLAGTDRGIARNAGLSEQALWAAEGGLRLVRAWFDGPARPDLPAPVPAAAEVDRSARLIDHDDDPATPPLAQDGKDRPRYKQGVDRDGDGSDDLFAPPYRGSLVHAFHGTPAGPDLRIDVSAGPAAAAYLASLSRTLFAGLPGHRAGLEPRLARIEIHGPPTAAGAGGRVRLGIATVRVMVRIVSSGAGSERVVAERSVTAVLDEIPYGAATGPLLACGDVDWPGRFTVGWGPARVAGDVRSLPGHTALAASWPRVLPAAAGGERLWGWDAPAAFTAYRSWLEATGERIGDPWLRLFVGGSVAGLPPGFQPFPFGWDPASGKPPSAGEWPNHDHPAEDGTHSNLFQGWPGLDCSGFDYTLWKSIATSGRRDTHYYTWAGGDRFREEGRGPARGFREITDGAEGLFFFDTANGLPPQDDDGDGAADNLTPALRLTGGTWGVRGLVYLNASHFEADLVRGRPAVFRAPGEPWQDGDDDGEFDPGETWINLRYPRIPGGPLVVDALDNLRDDGTLGGSPVRNEHGPAVAGEAAVWGVLFNAGTFGSGTEAVYHGAVVVGSAVRAATAASGEPVILYDSRLGTDWPPSGWRVPRVRVSRWDPGS